MKKNSESCKEYFAVVIFIVVVAVFTYWAMKLLDEQAYKPEDTTTQYKYMPDYSYKDTWLYGGNKTIAQTEHGLGYIGKTLLRSN